MKQNTNKDKKKEYSKEKFQEYIRKLEEEKIILGFPIKKRFLFIGGFVITVWLLFQISTVLIKPGFSKLDDNEKTYQELLEEQRKAVENGAVSGNQSFKEKNMQIENEKYNKAIESIKNLSNEEIKKILKEQGVENISDTEITEMKKRMAESIPKTPQEMEERMREIEDAMKNLNQTDSIQQENNKQNNK